VVKVMVVVRRKEGLTREEFVDHWCARHPAYVGRLPGIRRYRQNLAIEHRKDWPFDGIAELWFDSVKDVAIAFDGPAATELFAHEDDFLGEVQWFIAEETDVPLAGPSPAGEG
jgi:uncharacterized protein (TIGR02118 family)